MARLVSAVVGVVVLAAVALLVVWLLGQLLIGLGIFVVGLARVLTGVAKFLLIAGALCGLAYFLASAYRRG